MSQVLTETPFNQKGYTLGGIRLLIKEKGASSPGFRYVGNIHTPDLQPVLEFYEHFSAASGAEEKDFEAPNKTGYKLGFTADELLFDNLKKFMYGGNVVDVSEDLVTTASPETYVAGKTGSLHGLEFGKQSVAQRGDLVVYDVTGDADLVLDADYKITTLFGWTFIEFLVDTYDGSTIKIGEGVNAATDYHHLVLAGTEFAPMVNLQLEAAAILQIPSKIGKNFTWRIPRALIKPDGSLTLSAKEASTLKFSLELLSDSATDPNHPFGTIKDFGYDDAGAALV